ncbi:MAG: hypothetical protein K2X46_17345 [Roseomonas sp.]|nr:hypothetical protein [Roseomonas sp.]
MQRALRIVGCLILASWLLHSLAGMVLESMRHSDARVFFHAVVAMGSFVGLVALITARR